MVRRGAARPCPSRRSASITCASVAMPAGKAHWHDLHGPERVPKREIACAHCGTLFLSHRSNARFCCCACWRADYRQRHPRPSRAKPPPPPRACIECGATFQPRRRTGCIAANSAATGTATRGGWPRSEPRAVFRSLFFDPISVCAHYPGFNESLPDARNHSPKSVLFTIWPLIERAKLVAKPFKIVQLYGR